MALTPDDVRGIADYARIALGEAELVQMTSYLNDAVELLEPILAYDLGGVEPTFHPVGGMANVVREDVPVPGLSLSDALANAASTQGRAFRVPAILANEGGS